VQTILLPVYGKRVSTVGGDQGVADKEKTEPQGYYRYINASERHRKGVKTDLIAKKDK